MKTISLVLLLIIIQSCNNFEQSDSNIDIGDIQIDSITETRYAYIKEQIESNKNIFIKVDYVDYLTGEEAQKAEWRDKAYFIDGTDTITNITDGHYISNQNPKLRTFQIAKNALVENIIDDDETLKMKNSKEINSILLKSYIDKNTLLYFHIKNGIIIRIDERFVP